MVFISGSKSNALAMLMAQPPVDWVLWISAQGSTAWTQGQLTRKIKTTGRLSEACPARATGRSNRALIILKTAVGRPKLKDYITIASYFKIEFSPVGW